MSATLPSLYALRAFDAAARLENLSQAASELHVTHGAISRHIRSLESDLGMALFRRQGRGLVLTAAGLRLRESTAAAFARLHEACATIRHDATQSPFVLGCSGSLLARWVIPRLQRLSRELPELSIHLSAQETPPNGDLAGLDAALLLEAPPWPATWQVTVLATEQIGPVLSPRFSGWPRLREQPAGILQDEPVLHTLSRPQAWSQWAQAAGLDAAPPPGQAFEHLYYLIEAAIAGLGPAISPRPLVTDELAAGRLLAPWGFSPTSASWILATTRRLADPRVDALAAWLRDALAVDAEPAV